MHKKKGRPITRVRVKPVRGGKEIIAYSRTERGTPYPVASVVVLADEMTGLVSKNDLAKALDSFLIE